MGVCYTYFDEIHGRSLRPYSSLKCNSKSQSFLQSQLTLFHDSFSQDVLLGGSFQHQTIHTLYENFVLFLFLVYTFTTTVSAFQWNKW